MGERGTQRAGRGVPAGSSLTTKPEGPGGPGSPTAPVGPGRPWEKKEFRAGPANPTWLPVALTQELGHSPVPVVPSLQVPPAKNPETASPSEGQEAPQPLSISKAPWMEHRGAQPHCRVTTSQGAGRCYPGMDTAHTHPHSPSGQKDPGVLRGQQDPKKKY